MKNDTLNSHLKAEGDINLTTARQLWYNTLADRNYYQVMEDSGLFIHQSLSTPCIDSIAECEGSSLTTLTGNKILDFHGNNVHQVGYRNENVIRAAIQAMTTLPFSPRRYTNKYAIELAKKLCSLTPTLKRVLFAPGGSEVNSIAVKLARIATGKHKIVSMWGSFHGAGLDMISVGGEAVFRRNTGPLMPGVEHVPQPDSYRPISDNDPTQELYIAAIRQVFEHETDICALMAETIRNTDVQIPTIQFWQKVRSLCDEFNVVLILDEIPIALGRTGRFFAFEHYGIVPDIVTIGKGLGGGVFPMAAVLTTERFNVVAENSVGHFTHEKSPVGCAAALAVIQEIEEKNLTDRAFELGKYVKKRLEAMKMRYDKIGDVRGKGLLWAVDLVTDRKQKTRATKEAELIMYHCIENGLSFKVSLGNVISLSPALTISEQEMEMGLDILEQAFEFYL